MRDTIYTLILAVFTILVGILTVHYGNQHRIGSDDVFDNVRMEVDK